MTRRAGTPLRAVVITVHGLSGAASDFWMLDESLPPRGIAVCGLELRGMGNDPDVKQRGDIPSVRIWERDLLTFHNLVRARHPGVPVYLVWRKPGIAHRAAHAGGPDVRTAIGSCVPRD